jgi:hypothetical protein
MNTLLELGQNLFRRTRLLECPRRSPACSMDHLACRWRPTATPCYCRGPFDRIAVAVASERSAADADAVDQPVPLALDAPCGGPASQSTTSDVIGRPSSTATCERLPISAHSSRHARRGRPAARPPDIQSVGCLVIPGTRQVLEGSATALAALSRDASKLASR